VDPSSVTPVPLARPAPRTTAQTRHQDGAVVLISALTRPASPRSAGIDFEHVRRLAEVVDPLPPILVHRPTMQIIDGFHRVAAALHQGRDSVHVQFAYGPADLVFVMAVGANTTHGLPLSLADRRMAAARIIRTHAHWSDRAIAGVTGLSSKTVRGIRSEEGTAASDEPRVGKDGRVRPVNSTAGRALAAELIQKKPTASLREIAAEAGVSPNTVRDVRSRLHRNDDPVLAGSRSRRRRTSPSPDLRHTPADITPILDTLTRDPMLRMNVGGRKLLRWVHLHAVGPEAADALDPAPAHCLEHLIELAKRCSANWAKVASDLEQAHQSQTAV
jgi:hypothetical protein